MTPYDYVKNDGEWTQISFLGVYAALLLKGHHDPHELYPKPIQFISRGYPTIMHRITAMQWDIKDGQPIHRYHDWHLSATQEELKDFYNSTPELKVVQSYFKNFYDYEMLWNMKPNSHRKVIK